MQQLITALRIATSRANQYAVHRRNSTNDLFQLTGNFAKHRRARQEAASAAPERKGKRSKPNPPPSPLLDPHTYVMPGAPSGEESGEEGVAEESEESPLELSASDDDSVDAEDEPFLGVMHPLGEEAQADDLDDEEGVYDMEQYSLEHYRGDAGEA